MFHRTIVFGLNVLCFWLTYSAVDGAPILPSGCAARHRYRYLLTLSALFILPSCPVHRHRRRLRNGHLRCTGRRKFVYLICFPASFNSFVCALEISLVRPTACLFLLTEGRTARDLRGTQAASSTKIHDDDDYNLFTLQWYFSLLDVFIISSHEPTLSRLNTEHFHILRSVRAVGFFEVFGIFPLFHVSLHV